MILKAPDSEVSPANQLGRSTYDAPSDSALNWGAPTEHRVRSFKLNAGKLDHASWIPLIAANPGPVNFSNRARSRLREQR